MLVSIIIPCYNARAYVVDAIASALKQSWAEREIIVVDDGSTDGSAEEIEQLFGERVRLFRQNSAGAGAARNRALKEARGDFIQYLDADDLLDPRKIELQLAVGLTIPDAVTWCHWQPFHHQVGDMPFRVESAELDMSPSEYLRLYLDDRSNIPHTCHLIPRAIAEQAGPWDERLTLNDDGEYAARVVNCAQRLIHVDEGPFYFYRHVTHSLRTINSGRKIASAISALDKIANVAAARGIDLNTTKLAAKYFDLMIACFPQYRSLVPELDARISRLGGRELKAKIGGRIINTLASLIGWKAARRLQLARQELLGFLK